MGASLFSSPLWLCNPRISRGGVGAESVRALKEAYRLLLRSSLPLHEAREAISRLSDPLVTELARFVSGSKRGFHRE